MSFHLPTFSQGQLGIVKALGRRQQDTSFMSGSLFQHLLEHQEEGFQSV